MMKEKGFVLVTALFFLFLLSVIVLTSYDDVIMQYKLNRIAILRQQLFFLAEYGLKQGERQLADFSDKNVSVKVLALSKANEEKTTEYQIIAKAMRENQSVCLESIVEMQNNVLIRRSWNQVEGAGQC